MSQRLTCGVPGQLMILSRWQASTREVRDWALSARFEPGSDGSLPEQAIVVACNQTHPDRPY